ncbi:MAG: ATP-binding cassette domain-containing protein [Alphaproteobacteria bacterium]|nr:ATP-binding cassette domain-containing protein [Alphaproteobacteria bacterium]
MIETRALSKRYGPVVAVNGLDFQARDGEVTGLIGPNGAGKTTTFRTLCGIVQPDSGSARVDGRDAWGERLAVLARIGVLPDVRGLYPRLTPREHLAYFGALHGIEAPVLARRIDALIDRLDMSSFADRRARGFSRGQELKVALARALVHEPHNVILDEPTNGLDVVSTRAVRELVRELRGAGRCVVLASHVMSEVAQLCDRLFLIDRGRVVAGGTPDDLIRAFGAHDLEDVFLEAIGRARSLEAERRCA